MVEIGDGHHFLLSIMIVIEALSNSKWRLMMMALVVLLLQVTQQLQRECRGWWC